MKTWNSVNDWLMASQFASINGIPILDARRHALTFTRCGRQDMEGGYCIAKEISTNGVT